MRPLAAALIALVMTLNVPPAAAEDRHQAPSGIFTPRRLEPLVQGVVRAQEVQNARQQLRGAAARAPRRDSIVNGGLIGAAIGGVGGSALIVAAHGGSDNIPRAMLNVCVLPALAGFAAGALVDALH